MVMQMLELMGDQQAQQLMHPVAMYFFTRSIGSLSGVRVRRIQLGAAKLHTGRMIVAHETVQPMMWMVECAAEVE